MRSAAFLALAFGASAGARACDVHELAAGGLAAFGIPTFQQVDAHAGARLAAVGDAVVEALAPEAPAAGARDARAIRDGEPLAQAPAGRRFVVVSEEPDLALRLAARLAREGAARVTVVADGLPAWGPGVVGLESREE